MLEKLINLQEKRIEKRDTESLDPSERAELIHELFFEAMDLEDSRSFLSQPLFWDLVCYCNEVLSLYAIESGEEQLMTLAKLMSQQIYSVHYALPSGHEALGPPREEHERIWRKVIDDLKTLKELFNEDDNGIQQE